MSARGHCALARANRVFCTDEKRIRTENTVLVKRNKGLGLSLYKIDDPRGQFLVRATSQLCNIQGRELRRHV
jgi:hypothetical protein